MLLLRPGLGVFILLLLFGALGAIILLFILLLISVSAGGIACPRNQGGLGFAYKRLNNKQKGNYYQYSVLGPSC